MREFALKAPVPILIVETKNSSNFSLNPCAARWELTRTWSTADWQTLASTIEREFSSGTTEGCTDEVCWQCTEDLPCVMAWLTVASRRSAQPAPPEKELIAAMALKFAGFGVWTFDLVTGKRTWDDQMLRLRGYDPPNAPSVEQIMLAMPQEGLRALDASMYKLAQMVREGRAQKDPLPPEVDFEVVWPDGSRHWLRANGSVVENAGEHPYLVGLHWDVTESRRLAELERQSAVAEARARAISQALSTVSHEVRTPLNAILGLSRRLQRRTSDPAALGDVDKIERSAKHMLGLVNDILDLAKIEADRLQIDSSPFSLHEMVKYAVDTVQQLDLPGASAVRATVGMAVENIYVGDALRLSQVLINLLTNAAKFSPESKPVSIEVDVVDAGSEAPHVQFDVTDLGPGMNQEQVDRLFRPFEQLGTPDQQKGGTGLGLAISQRLVRAMGGDIAVRSAPGRGSTFSFSIPLGKWTDTAEPATPRQPGRKVDLIGHSVLIVDDNEIGRELASEVLLDSGAAVLLAASSQEALDVLQQRVRVSAILMDCQMPVMDGLALTRTVRLDPRWNEVPIIGLSGNAGPAERARAIGAGMDDYLTKPFEPDQLVSVVKWWSKRHDAA